MNEQRDVELGARLDELEVQEHGPGYWDSVMTAAEPELEGLRAGATENEDGRAGSPAGPARRLLGGRRWLWIPAAALVTAAAAIVLLFGLPGRGQGDNPVITFGGPQPASAAEAIRYALGALDRAQAIKGTAYVGKVHGGAFKAGDKVTFRCARDGSFLITTRTVGPDALYPLPDYVETTAYDAHTRRAQGVFDYGAKGFSFENTTQDPVTGANVTTVRVYRYVFSELPDVPPAPPDFQIYSTDAFPLWQVRAYLRTMLGDPRVKFSTGEVGGQKVWLLSTNEFAGGSYGKTSKGKPVTIAIDARTRLPLRIVGFRGDHELRIDSAAYAAKPAASEFMLQKPPAAETNDQSESEQNFLAAFMSFPGLPFGDAAGMRKAVDDLPACPGWVPRGFAFQTGASRTFGGAIDIPRRAGSPRRSIPDTVVSLAYRRGFDAAYVTLRPDPRLNHRSMTGLPGEKRPHIRIDTSDPFISTVAPWDRAQWRSHTTDVRLTTGAFGGAVAHIVVDPGFWPHLWVKSDGWVATVAGDLTGAEMIRIAESLGPWSEVAGR